MTDQFSAIEVYNALIAFFYLWKLHYFVFPIIFKSQHAVGFLSDCMHFTMEVKEINENE